MDAEMYRVISAEMGPEPTWQVLGPDERLVGGLKFHVQLHAHHLSIALNHAMEIDNLAMAQALRPKEPRNYTQHGLPALRPEDRPNGAHAAADCTGLLASAGQMLWAEASADMNEESER